MCNKIFQLFLVLFPILLTCPALSGSGRILHVSKNGSNQTGLNWEEAFTSINGAINSASPGDQIWVEQGIYHDAIVLKSNVSILGGFSGDEDDSDPASRDWEENATILRPPELRHRGPLVSGIDIVNATLDGFTISGHTFEEGAGVFCERSEVNFNRCSIRECTAYTRTNSSCSNGICRTVAIYGLGGAINIRDCTRVVICDSSFERNDAGQGGALYVRDSLLELDRVHFISNSAVEGGGIYATRSMIQGHRCLFDQNSVTRYVRSTSVIHGPFGGGSFSTIDPGEGAAIFSWSSMVELTNSVLSRNRATGNSPLVKADMSEISFLHSTLISDSTVEENDIGLEESSLVVQNSILNTNIARPFSLDESTVEVTHSLLRFDWPGEGNVVGDPVFLNPEKPDYRLRGWSPGLDMAIPAETVIDFDGNPRPVDLENQGVEGDRLGFDMGAFERPLQGYFSERNIPLENPRSDIDGNGSVDLVDLHILLGDWGKVSAAASP